MQHPDFSPLEIEDLLETLEDHKCLNKNGLKLRKEFWGTFIKE
jgi:hypothetical protein